MSSLFSTCRSILSIRRALTRMYKLRWLVRVCNRPIVECLLTGGSRFIFWAMAYLSLHPGKLKWNGIFRSCETLFNYFLILLGAYVLVAGSYVGFALHQRKFT